MIPASAEKPADGRTNRATVLTVIDGKKDQLAKMRPLTEGGAECLREEFVVEFTYNSIQRY